MKPTDSELEILHLLWENGPLTVRELNDKLNEIRRVGYTTSLKMMQIMTEKGLLTRDTSQRSHVYSPSLRPEDVQSNILDHVLKTVFMGDRSRLVLQALGNHHITSEEIAELKTLIKKIEET
jgi:BlaI family transcriptional regulator, penicillinase repressor